MGKLVGAARDKVFKGEPLVEVRVEVFTGRFFWGRLVTGIQREKRSTQRLESTRSRPAIAAVLRDRNG